MMTPENMAAASSMMQGGMNQGIGAGMGAMGGMPGSMPMPGGGPNTSNSSTYSNP